MAEKRINIRKNKLLYPFQIVLIGFVHLLFLTAKHILPKRYRNEITEYENSETVVNIIGLTLFNALGGAILMLTNIKIANTLGAAIYGVFSYYVAIGEVGINFVRYGRDKSMTRDLIQLQKIRNKLIANTIALNWINLIVFLLVICSISSKLDLPINFASTSIITATCLVSLDLQPVYESLNLMSWHSLYTILQRLLNIVLIWIPIFLFNYLNLDYLGIALIVSWSIVLVIQYREVITQLCIKIKNNVSTSSLVSLYKNNFLIAASCMFGVAFGPLIRLILKNYVDDVAVGLYSACFQIFLISKFILTQIARVGNPLMAEAGKECCSIAKRKQFIIKYLILMLSGSLPFALPMVFCASLITEVCFTSEYNEIHNYIPFFGIYLLTMSLGNVYEQFLISMRKDNIYFTIYMGCSILTIIMALVLVPMFKVMGGIIAFIIPNILARILYLIFGLNVLNKTC